MQEYAEDFYKSKKWQACRDAYLRSVNMLCERCLQDGLMRPAEIVHHKKHITPKNINNPDITLNWNNLQAVCRKCHGELHEKHFRRYIVQADGTIIPRDNAILP